jgi:transposase
VRRPDDGKLPKSREARQEEAEKIGADGHELLGEVFSEESPAWLRQVPAAETLRKVWVQNFFYDERGDVGWRTSEEGIPRSTSYINSPIDPDCRYARKSTTSWVGYRVHLTETCEEGLPNIVTDVQTAPAPVADGEATPLIHESLSRKGLLPETQFVDTGYLDAELLAESRERYGVDLFGPTRPDYRWQARAQQGFGAQDFRIDWEGEKATCPEGHESIEWTPKVDVRGNDAVEIRFSTADCGPCSSRSLCTLSRAKHPRRRIQVRPREQHEALEAARDREKAPDFARRYAARAGIEGTVSRAVRTCGVRRSRYVGLTKTHLHHLLSATSLSFVRVGEWLMGAPKAETRRSPFARLMAQPAAA